MNSKMLTGIITILVAAGLCAGEFSEAQAKVKAKFPEEFEEILKLAETDFDAARKKLNELARKANVKLPGGTDYGRSDSSRGGQFGGRGSQFGGRGGQFGGRGGRSGQSGSQTGGRGGQFGGRGGGARPGRMGGASAEPPKELVNDSNLRRLEFRSRNGDLKYCEFLENGDTEGPMSLVLLMHGLSNSGSDNLRQLAMPAIKPLLNYLRQHKIKALVLIPQCPKDKSWIRDSDMLEILHDLVETKREKYNISYAHSIISGFSMGGGGCFSYMMRHPKVFRKAILVSAGGRAARPDKLQGEFYIAVGSRDRFVSPENSEKFAKELSRKNKVRFEMPDLDHIETAQKIYSGDCWDWAFDRK